MFLIFGGQKKVINDLYAKSHKSIRKLSYLILLNELFIMYNYCYDRGQFLELLRP